jgi:hypothetical protein
MSSFSARGSTIHHGNALDFYDAWEPPAVIVSDGAYGLGLFDGDPSTPRDLVEWYEPHVKKWSEKATNATTLWFWNTEIGWAIVHPLLDKHGWEYLHANTWDKGIIQIAGRCDVDAARMFPVVNEFCVHYVRKVVLDGLPFQQWLRKEWDRTGLPFSDANKACGVANAATRKYLAPDQWYAPPIDMLEKIIDHANEHGDPSGRPYFILKNAPGTAGKPWNETRRMIQASWNEFKKNNRATFHCPMGVTNVWRLPPMHNKRERLKNRNGNNIHLNQKPLKIIKMLVEGYSLSSRW